MTLIGNVLVKVLLEQAGAFAESLVGQQATETKLAMALLSNVVSVMIAKLAERAAKATVEVPMETESTATYLVSIGEAAAITMFPTEKS